MGRCHEFGLQISEGCNHEMLAGENECTCAGCGIACGGQFAGCPDVWARGQPTVLQTELGIGRTATLERVSVGAPANGVAAAWPPEPPLPPVEPLLTSTSLAPPLPDNGADGASIPTPERAGAPTEPAPSGADPASSRTFTDVSSELRTVAEGLKLQQSMLGELLTGLTRQQAMMAELLDSRHAELRLAMVAESLPDSVAEAVTRSWAANQEQLTEDAIQLAKSIGMDAAVTKALRQVANRSEEKFEELCTRQEKLVAKAMRAGARQEPPRRARQPETKPAATRKTAAGKPAAANKSQPAKKTSRTSSQGTRPSRRSLGS